MDQKTLDDIYAKLATATEDYRNAEEETILVKDTYDTLRLAKLTNGEITGKNEDERKASTATVLAAAIRTLKSCEAEERATKLIYDLSQQRVDHAKLSIRLMELEQKDFELTK